MERSHGRVIKACLISGIKLILLLKPLSFAEHRSSDTGGGGFAAQLYRARGDDIWESGVCNPVCQTHLHSNPGGRKLTIPLFIPHTHP